MRRFRSAHFFIEVCNVKDYKRLIELTAFRNEDMYRSGFSVASTACVVARVLQRSATDG